MTSIPSSSRSDSTQRRRTSHRHRQVKLQALWRTLAVSGLLGGLVWGTTTPIWVLRQSNQIVISGNHLLSAKAIRSLLPLSYPQWLVRIEPAVIVRSLEAQPAIADAKVTRQLFPPGLTVQVKERVPVAIAILGGSLSSSRPIPKASMGLLDENGVWIPLESYTALSSTLESPSLKVIGTPEQYRSYWIQLYQAVVHSPIKVFEIDCQDPANLILRTELGIVHLGPYSPQLAEQLSVLAQIRKLPAQVNPSQVAYISLKNPKSPSVQMHQTTKPVNSDLP